VLHDTLCLNTRRTSSHRLTWQVPGGKVHDEAWKRSFFANWIFSCVSFLPPVADDTSPAVKEAAATWAAGVAAVCAGVAVATGPDGDGVNDDDGSALTAVTGGVAATSVGRCTAVGGTAAEAMGGEGAIVGGCARGAEGGGVARGRATGAVLAPAPAGVVDADAGGVPIGMPATAAAACPAVNAGSFFTMPSEPAAADWLRVRSMRWITLAKIASPAMRLIMSTIDLISF
jgi:hypothetical protein